MSSQNITFLGATGGCTLAAVVRAIKEGNITASALARTPDKLVTLLKNEGITEGEISKSLRIVQGSITDLEALKEALLFDGKVADKILTGTGGMPKFQASLTLPITTDQPNICNDTITNLFKALSQIYSSTSVPIEKRPLLVMISTTGISEGVEDVPFGLQTLYHFLLATPHIDKKKAEALIYQDAASAEPGIRNFVVVRPTLLTGTASAKDVQPNIKVGTEQAPAKGYGISRASVGNWIFDQVLKAESAKWEGEKVTLTA